MTNYNERLEEVLEELVRDGQNDVDDLSLNTSPHKIVAQNGAKQALTSLIKELVAEAKPARAIISDDEMGIDRARKSAANNAIDVYEQNLLKALEER